MVYVLISILRKTKLINLNSIVMTLKLNSNPVARRSFNSIFDDLLNEIPSFDGKDWNVAGFNNPPVNIHENAEAFHLELNVPGRKKEDFKINVENGLLTISFEKKEENSVEGYKTVRREFSYKSFKRSFNLDQQIEADQIQAKYENGVLKLLLPKKAEAKDAVKQINVA
jgi:HSP20 family protein